MNRQHLYSSGKQPQPQHLRGPSRHELRNSQQFRRSLQEKWTAAQQRLYERDKRRKITNPYRTQAEEDAERVRMHEQGLIDPRRDPYNRMFGDHEYAYYREQRLQEDCRLLGINCNVHALEWDPGDRRYDYDWIHDEHYLGTSYDPYPHDTTHKAYDPAYYPIDYEPYPYPSYEDLYGVVYDPSLQLGLVDPTSDKEYRDSRYAQQHAQEYLRNCRRYGIDCNQFALLQLREDDPGVKCSGARCSANNIFEIADIVDNNDTADTADDGSVVHHSETIQKQIEQHQRDCRLFGVNCDVSDLENDNIGYDDEHDSAFPYDHEVYDYYRDEVDD